MADQHVLYRDEATGVTYDVSYDYYTDPLAVVLDYVLVNDREVHLRSLSADLKARMRVAARAAYEAQGAEEWRRLDLQAAARRARVVVH